MHADYTISFRLIGRAEAQAGDNMWVLFPSTAFLLITFHAGSTMLFKLSSY
jgi:hypothetical protein